MRGGGGAGAGGVGVIESRDVAHVRKALEKCDREPQRNAASFAGDTHLFNDACIFRDLIAGHDAELFCRAAAHRKTQLLEFAAYFGITPEQNVEAGREGKRGT